VSKLGSEDKLRPGPRPDRGRPRTANRPDIRDDIPRRVLFSEVGQTGWGRRRDLGDYKGNKSEKNFDHLNEQFWGEGDDPV
jgi:hypothetical protein